MADEPKVASSAGLDAMLETLTVEPSPAPVPSPEPAPPADAQAPVVEAPVIPPAAPPVAPEPQSNRELMELRERMAAMSERMEMQARELQTLRQGPQERPKPPARKPLLKPGEVAALWDPDLEKAQAAVEDWLDRAHVRAIEEGAKFNVFLMHKYEEDKLKRQEAFEKFTTQFPDLKERVPLAIQVGRDIAAANPDATPDQIIKWTGEATRNLLNLPGPTTNTPQPTAAPAPPPSPDFGATGGAPRSAPAKGPSEWEKDWGEMRVT